MTVSELSLAELEGLVRRAMRVGVWRRIELEQRAAIRVVQWVMRRGGRDLVERVGRNSTVLGMVRRASEAILEALHRVPRALPFGIRALLEGTRIANHRIQAYREHGVFCWAPEARRWLQDEDVVIYLGANSLGSPRYGGL